MMRAQGPATGPLQQQVQQQLLQAATARQALSMSGGLPAARKHVIFCVALRCGTVELRATAQSSLPDKELLCSVCCQALYGPQHTACFCQHTVAACSYCSIHNEHRYSPDVQCKLVGPTLLQHVLTLLLLTLLLRCCYCRHLPHGFYEDELLGAQHNGADWGPLAHAQLLLACSWCEVYVMSLPCASGSQERADGRSPAAAARGCSKCIPSSHPPCCCGARSMCMPEHSSDP
jgi:hypothetical protein